MRRRRAGPFFYYPRGRRGLYHGTRTTAQSISSSERLAGLRGVQIARDARGQVFALFESSYRLGDAAKELGRDAAAKTWGSR